MNIHRVMGSAFVAMSLMSSFAINADDDVPMNRISFQVETDREVANDEVQATLSTTDEGRNPAHLADEINKTMAWALKLARSSDKVKVESGSYQTQPVYEKSQIKRWRASQQLILRANDVAEISDMIGELQSRLQLNSIHFSVSDKTRRVIQDDLIKDALGRFQARAELVRRSLGAKSWENVQISINSGASYPSPRHYNMKASAMRMEADVSAPALAGGTSKVTVRINGTIELTH